MFESARLKLTAWYLLIIFTISVVFSSAFYHVSTREVQRLINRLEVGKQLEETGAIPPLPRGRNMPTIEELQELKARALFTLFIINGAILVCAGGASYFLAGRTLHPIKMMVDEQNIFISNASHELRTPLATLRAEMESNLLEKHITNKQARALITSNLEEVNTLQGLTNSLLKITQAHTRTEKPTCGNIPLQEIIKQAEKKVITLAKQKNIVIKKKTISAEVCVNAQELIECFVILMDNAIKYSEPNTTITIESSVAGKTVTTHITDEGMGISQKDMPHIFTRFYRADTSRSQIEGYGLGLSIAHDTLIRYKGNITVHSKEGSGSTFSIRLPLA